MQDRLRNFENFENHRLNNLKDRQSNTFQSTAKRALHNAGKLRSKSHLDMRDLLLQEKLLGTMGRWEEAINNQKVQSYAHIQTSLSSLIRIQTHIYNILMSQY